MGCGAIPLFFLDKKTAFKTMVNINYFFICKGGLIMRYSFEKWHVFDTLEQLYDLSITKIDRNFSRAKNNERKTYPKKLIELLEKYKKSQNNSDLLANLEEEYQKIKQEFNEAIFRSVYPLRDIYLNNFSVFKDIKIEFCKGINIFIGDNGIGKTQLLKFIYALHESAYEKNGSSKDYECLNQVQFIDSCFRPYSISSLANLNKFTDNSTSNVSSAILSITDNVFYKLESLYDNEGTDISLESILHHKSPSIFFPAKEMLSHSTLLNMSEVYGNDMPFDSTYLRIIELARRWKMKEIPEIAINILPKIEKQIDGTVVVKDDGSFWMQKTNNLLVPFVNESDGLKRFALIWQLLMNECINKNSVIFWDEPENSINPLNIPLCVDILLELQRHGVQIFVSTHSYTLARYFELIKNNNDTIRYHSLYKDNDGFIKNSYA